MGPRSCSVAAGVGCHVPANVVRGAIRNRFALLAVCYQCGEDVCRDYGCSRLTGIPKGMSVPGQRRVRLCKTCIEEIDRLGS